MMALNEFLLGALALGFLAAAMFFGRFYTRTRDRFFAFMSTAFGIMSANQIALFMLGEDSEYRSWVYVVRLAAFVLILVAIVDKNRD
jgi:hypothetical protein